MIPIKDGENPPNARHCYEDALHDPKRRWKELPSDIGIQMVRFGQMLKI
jgi:hypothetical protein